MKFTHLKAINEDIGKPEKIKLESGFSYDAKTGIAVWI